MRRNATKTVQFDVEQVSSLLWNHCPVSRGMGVHFAVEYAPIAVDKTSEPYDPNDEDAVLALWEGATIRRNGVVTGQVRRRGPARNATKKTGCDSV